MTTGYYCAIFPFRGGGEKKRGKQWYPSNELTGPLRESSVVQSDFKLT